MNNVISFLLISGAKMKVMIRLGSLDRDFIP